MTTKKEIDMEGVLDKYEVNLADLEQVCNLLCLYLITCAMGKSYQYCVIKLCEDELSENV